MWEIGLVVMDEWVGGGSGYQADDSLQGHGFGDNGDEGTTRAT